VAWQSSSLAEPSRKARIAITLDLEMARNFPTWEQTHWDYEKGNLDEATKRYALAAGKRVKSRGGVIHYFAVGRVLEQENVGWLEELIQQGHPIGNHTYDHVNVKGRSPSEIQFRFARSPWLVAGQKPEAIIEQNIRLTNLAMKERLGIAPAGFRTPGGFHPGLSDRPDVQAMLQRIGFEWVSSKYPAHLYGKPNAGPTDEDFQSIVAAQAAAQPFIYPSGLIELPMSPISDVTAFRSGQWKLDAFVEAIDRAVRWSIENGAVFDFLAHPSCLGVVDPKFQTIDRICKLVDESHGQASIVSLSDVAKTLSTPKP
jgi:hypothetical protein